MQPPPSYNSLAVDKQVKFTIPKGVRAGNTVTVNLPTGKSVKITVPKGCKPGNTITVNYKDKRPQSIQPTQSNYQYEGKYNQQPTYPVVTPVAVVPSHYYQPQNNFPSAPPQQQQQQRQQQQQQQQQHYPQVMAVPVNPNNNRRSGGGAQWTNQNKNLGGVGRDTYLHGITNDTSRDAELARRLANPQNWESDQRLQNQLQEQENREYRRRQEQEQADAKFAQKFADTDGDGFVSREEQLAFQQSQQYQRPTQSPQVESDAAMARRLAAQWDTYDGR